MSTRLTATPVFDITSDLCDFTHSTAFVYPHAQRPAFHQPNRGALGMRFNNFFVVYVSRDTLPRQSDSQQWIRWIIAAHFGSNQGHKFCPFGFDTN
jgi:hypothetical protein